MSDVKDEFIDQINLCMDNSTFIRLTLGKYRGEGELKHIYVRPVMIKGNQQYQCNYRYSNKDVQRNLEKKDCLQLIRDELGGRFLNATLFSSLGDIVIEYNRKRIPRIVKRKSTFTSIESALHNKLKRRFVDRTSLYLNKLGITGKGGDIKSEKYDKFRQIDKFIEIVDGLYKSSELVSKKKLNAIDLGSGKSYLSFAMFDWFRNHYQKVDISLIGIEQRKDLVEFSNKVALELNFKGLRFLYCKISGYKVQSADIVTALHACDIATDDAIAKALEMRSSLIILAPCCHKYVRNKLKVPAELKSVLKHGIIEEHFASFLTDSLRALVLEYYGYRVKVFEFISHEHTSKNIMITAVKKNKYLDKNKKEEILRLKSMFKLEDFYLDKILHL